MANLAKRISQGSSAASEFWYGPGRERIRQLAQKSGSLTEDTRYVGGLYEKVSRNGGGGMSTENVHYVRAGGQAIAVVKRESGALQTRYLHRDHLGSVVALTDTTGAVVERYSYDPWGKRRDPSSWVTPAPGTFAFDPSYGDRGYTGHEHIDHLGLVNMNGRIYDPELGKFLSADPTTQFPESTQGWNRYAYTGNNPLSYTDPSGFSFLKTVMQAVGIVLQFIPGFQGWSLAWWQSMMMGFASGFLASGGDLRAGLIGAATADLMNGIGSQYQGLMDSKCFSDAAMIGMKVEKAFLDGVVGGAASALNKGDFRDGFLGAASGSLAGSFAKLSSNRAVATAQAAAIGGTVSTIGGGKFGNGAITATFAYVYNQAAHSIGQQVRNRRFEVPDNYRAALAEVFNVSPEVIDKITVTEYSDVARLHGKNTIATTRVNAIYLRSSGINFLVDHDLLLHEYYHVVRQWNTGNLTASRYIVESMRSGYWENRFEVAARTFARDNIDRFDALLRNTTEGQ